MSLVKFTADSSEGCGVILNESAVKDRSYCGMKSIHGTEEEPLYFICGECKLKLLYSEDLQAKRV